MMVRRWNISAHYGYADNTRLSTAQGNEKAAEGYVTVGYTVPIPIDKTTYPSGAVICVTGAKDVLGHGSPYTDSAWTSYRGDGTQFKTSSYIMNTKAVIGTFTIDEDRTGFTLDIAELTAPYYFKFCVKGIGADLTATLTTK